jgi:membrane protein YqaA with SNARE-associated domain
MALDINPNKYKHWPYKNTALVILSVSALYYLADTPAVQIVINGIGSLGYIGAFITGIFFVSTFTVAPAAVVLFDLAHSHNPWEVALLAGAGAMIGDLIIFRFFRDHVFEELKVLYDKIAGPHFTDLFRTPYFAWIIPIIGAIIVASPFPDEIGIGLLGISKLKTWQFLIITFILNALGILLVIGLAKVV